MGVLDLLPNAVSGVYFIYHSDFEKWHLGKVSACREACLSKEGGYKYYYMGEYTNTLRFGREIFGGLIRAGYYIPNCQKMRYKGEYGPSELLDPDTNEWLPLTEELRKQLIEDPSWGGRFQPDSDCKDGQDRGPGFCIESGMPGLMSPSELDAFNIGQVRVRAYGVELEVEGEILRDLVKETVATVGAEVAGGMEMVF
jgi:hypothetical protein